eukprot:1279260-Rhodomonas_salina.2
MDWEVIMPVMPVMMTIITQPEADSESAPRRGMTTVTMMNEGLVTDSGSATDRAQAASQPGRGPQWPREASKAAKSSKFKFISGIARLSLSLAPAASSLSLSLGPSPRVTQSRSPMHRQVSG